MAYRHILIATGGAKHSLKAEARALKLAQVLGAKVSILSVVRLSGAVEGVLSSSPIEAGALAAQVYEDLQRRQEEVLQDAKSRFEATGLKVQTFLDTGSAGPIIVEKARELNCDLIVLGRRKLSMIGAAALGSVSDYVNRRAACDVLIVH